MRLWIEHIRQDVRFALRTFTRSPGPALVAILTLALGIGAATAMWTVVDSVLLRPLPYTDSDGLVWIWSTNPQNDTKLEASNPDFADWRQQSRSLDIAGWGGLEINLTGMGEPERLTAALTMGDFFSILGAPPVLGTLEGFDEVSEEEPTVVLGHGIWQRRFGADPDVVGRQITLNNLVYTVVGVMGPDFRFPAETVDLWIPLVRFNPALATRRGARLIEVVGRLRPGFEIEEAQADMDRIAAALSSQYPETNQGVGVELVPAIEEMTGGVSRTLWMLFAAAGCLLLIASVNLANLFLVRASVREQELGVRTALGATRWRIAIQVLVESVLMSLVGGMLGCVLAYWGVEAFGGLVPEGLPRADEIALDWRMLASGVFASLVIGFMLPLASVKHSWRSNLAVALSRGGRRGSAAPGSRFRGLLVVSEVALAMVVLAGAGLLMNSYWRLSRSDPGFDPANVLAFSVTWPSDRYPIPAEVFGDLQERLLVIPGVRAASTGLELPDRGLPMVDDAPVVSEVEGQTVADIDRRGVSVLSTQPGYFTAMGIPLVRGRDFVAADMRGPNRVAIINESLAQAYFPNQDPVGQRFTLDSWTLQGAQAAQIVGVAADVKHNGLNTPARLRAYLPLSQRPVWTSNVVVRTEGDPSGYVGLLREAVAAIDADQPVYDIRTLEERIADSIAEDRFRALFLGVFSAIALALAAVGLYGVLAYVTTTRTREVGIRMALGARVWQVRMLVLRQGMRWAVAGIVLGIAGAAWLTRFAEALIFGIAPTDLPTFGTVTVVLLLVALAACWIPARRTTKVDPAAAMRSE